ncbi:hypothetical protein [Corynebacterium ammoniagenes]|uniref:Uncharacterized protein n=2 Tax=Corynebacterium ammoniagenes TaxID=1697 RepID=A0AAV5GBV1_CORAM|nr:hypothetical protein [Corynebacterium ammoniagenes]APT83260.1 membrane protein [Corynebacterium ammoniagenes DSM 20306]AQS74281.1 hypothetical protein CA40472_10520 [Corynebacterium ammoniagenes]EFG81497.1 hypothetical protein HMPREF0281_01275 [Corynebacterium ammoniagenes DSM 20306]NMF32853.1 hypothetical protein [Corynebacterium ammoniagenes]GJN43560.1 hypothetical protein CAT723_20390 [Corynebacterium ammoniagenes]
MRYVYSGFAALLCLAALLANLGDMPTFVALACLAVAAIFLVLALRTNQTLQPGRGRELTRADLSDDQAKKIKTLLAEGQFGTAVNQIQLWFKYVSYAEAESFIQNFQNLR